MNKKNRSGGLIRKKNVAVKVRAKKSIFALRRLRASRASR
jgi:hypothetical protein